MGLDGGLLKPVGSLDLGCIEALRFVVLLRADMEDLAASRRGRVGGKL